MKKGFLSIVGTGIQAPGQMTLESVEFIRNAEKVFFLVPDPFASRYVKELNPSAEDLHHLYVPGQHRMITYNHMVETILGHVRSGKRVCAAFYGHPGVFAYPTHKAIHDARSEGFQAVMMPGISAEDCIVADLGLDPSIGCHSYEATSFLVRPIEVHPSCLLILWQVGVIGDLKYSPKQSAPSDGMKVLARRLLQFYPGEHEAIVYEASFSPAWDPRCETVRISALPDVDVNGISTLIIPPLGARPTDRNMAISIGIDGDSIGRSPHSSSFKLYEKFSNKSGA